MIAMTEDHTAKDHTCDFCAADTHEFVAYRDAASEYYDPYEEYHRQHPMFIKGAEQERNRIIAIIENAIIDSEGYCHADTVIALIKGENE